MTFSTFNCILQRLNLFTHYLLESIYFMFYGYQMLSFSLAILFKYCALCSFYQEFYLGTLVTPLKLCGHP